MNLKTFVEQSLIQIIRGVHDAQREAKRYNAVINPVLAEELDQKKRAGSSHMRPSQDMLERLNLLETSWGKPADMVEFDIAITASSQEAETTEKGGSAKAGISIKVVSAELGGTGKKSRSEEHSDERVSRVKFRVPIVYPQHRNDT